MIITQSEMAARLGVKEQSLKGYVKQGLLPAAKIGSKYLFIEQDVEDAVRQLYTGETSSSSLRLQGDTTCKLQRSALLRATENSVTTSATVGKEYDELLMLAPKKKRN